MKLLISIDKTRREIQEQLDQQAQQECDIIKEDIRNHRKYTDEVRDSVNDIKQHRPRVRVRSLKEILQDL